MNKLKIGREGWLEEGHRQGRAAEMRGNCTAHA